MEKHYNKLVRDEIPRIIEESGSSCVTEILSEEACLEKLEEKLSEELAEYMQSKSLEELADLLEVIYALVAARGSTWQEVEQLRMEKKEKRGGFEKRIFLRTVEERNDG